MPPEHYCVIHEVPFFKKGKMKGYAHPIGDTGKWCNEEEEEKAVPSQATETKTESPKVSSYQRGSPDERASIEAQTAFRGTVELMVAKAIDSTSPLWQTALNYAASKLSNWASQGSEVVSIDPELKKDIQDALQSLQAKTSVSISESNGNPPKGFIDLIILQEQLERLQSEKGWDNKNVLAYMAKTYKVEGATPLEVASKLDMGQANHFLAQVEKAVAKLEAVERR